MKKNENDRMTSKVSSIFQKKTNKPNYKLHMCY